MKAKGYDHVYALIDMDKVIEEEKLADYQIAKQSAERSGVFVLENNPCFEIWILLHFSATGKLFSSCGQVISEIKRPGIIPDYQKGGRYLSGLKLYERYKNLLVEKAIPNAKKLQGNKKGQSVRYPRAETFRFFEWYFSNRK